MENATRPCARCAEQFEPAPSGAASSWCRSCRNEYAAAWARNKTKRCPLTGRTAGMNRTKAVRVKLRRRLHRPARRTFTCANPACHNLCVTSQSEAAYCSNPCKLIGKKIRRRGLHGVVSHPHWILSQPVYGPTMDWLLDLPVHGPTLESWPKFGPAKPGATRITGEVQCRWCERMFERDGRNVSFCSETCSNLHRGVMAPECPIEYATCPDAGCGALYVFDARNSRPSGCCQEHSTRIARRRRKRAERARKRNQVHEPYTLREIAERDGWRCHLCGGRVPDQKYAARDNDPTIDHLIPQSHGGDDTKLNVALAHNRCNWERGNQGLAQLRLVG